MSSTRNIATDADLLKVGVVVSAHGIKGGVKIRSFTADPHDLTSYGALTDPAQQRIFNIAITGESGGNLLAMIEGVTTRESAEALRGTELYIRRSALPALDEDEFYPSDLVGLRVVNERGDTVGRVISTPNFGAGDLIEIEETKSSTRQLYLFIRAIFPAFDFDKGTITFHPPDDIDPSMLETDA